jgi:hypothetical protein
VIALFVWGGIAVLCVIAVTVLYGDARHDTPRTPRRGTRTRLRGRGAVARLHALLAAVCSRARATAAGGTSWGRQAIALRVHGITTTPGSGTPEPKPPHPYCIEHDQPLEWCAHYNLTKPPGQPESPAREPTRKATRAERDQAGLDDSPLYSWQTGEFAAIIEAGEQ